MNKYSYDGPVMEFDRLIANRWHGETMAKSESKAKSNLLYQFKTQNHRMPGAKISFPGQIKMIGWKDGRYGLQT